MFHVKHQDQAILPEVDERLEVFAGVLRKWNSRINLISRSDERNLWSRHIADSAQLAQFLPKDNGSLLDLGSGAGFPGFVLALMTRWHVHLVESDQRKSSFLREAARVTEANVEIHTTRAEALPAMSVDVVTSRALGPLSYLLGLAEPHISPTRGICLFLKGRTAAAELTSASSKWRMRVEQFPSRTDPSASLLRISEISRAG